MDLDNVETWDAEEQSTVSGTIYWLKATAHQGKRVLESSIYETKHFNSAIYNSPRRMEELFFLTACRKAHRWMQPVREYSTEAARFFAFEGVVKKVRDSREHEEERYGLRKRRDDEISPANTDSALELHVSRSITVERHGRLVLGGLVDVAEIIEAAELLLVQFISKHRAYWDWRISYKPEVAESYYIERDF